MDRGRADGGQRLSRITVNLQRTAERQAALERLLQEQEDPASPNYRRWLTPEEFGARFGLAPEAVERAAAWLRAQGLRVASIARGGGWIVASGSVAQAERAFHTEIHRYEAGGRMHYAPAGPVEIPAELRGLAGSVRGLDDFGWEAPRRWQTLYTASNGTHMLAPGDVANIYGIAHLQAGPNAPKGAGQKIAVAGQSAIDPADIRLFRSTFGLSKNEPTAILAGDDPGIDRDGPLQEADADIEWAGAIAPDAQVVYVYAADVLDAVQYAIDQNVAPVISLSYGTCETNLSRELVLAAQALAQQANAQGITWVGASGDTGAGCDQKLPATHGLGVLVPVSIPEVTGVGGTEFNEGGQDYNYWEPYGAQVGPYTTAFGYIPETAWNDSTSVAAYAGGGGASVVFAKPAWQTGPGVPDNGARNVPDLSFSASEAHDPYLVVTGGQTYAYGGTSVAAPLFAGVLALANQVVAASDSGPAGLGNVNPSLYALAQPTGPVPITPFRDITTGNNMVACATGTPDCVNGTMGYAAGPGYDQVTGLGSLYVEGFVLGYRIATVTALQISPTQLMTGGSVTWTVRVQPADPASAANRGPLTGSISFLGSMVTLDASGRASGTATLSWLAPGTYTMTAVYGGDSRFGQSQSAPVTLTILPPPPVTPTAYWPPDQGTGVPLSFAFGFYGSDWNDIYFGTTNPPPFWGTVPAGYPMPSGVMPNTKYYWRVTARNASGTATSPVWSFTTTPFVGYTISTLAGTGKSGFSGDGGPANQAQLTSPSDIVVDRTGNVLVTDGNRIRQITPAGTITTIAGTGDKTDSGDGGPAIAAGLSSPSGLAVDAQGTIYVATGNRVRKIGAGGTIMTIAGGEVGGYGGDGGPAVNAQLKGPHGLALDEQGNLYVADFGNNCIRKIAGGTITTVAGECGFTNYGNVGDGGPATYAVLTLPAGVAVDAAGTLYVADYYDYRVRKIANGTITTVAGGGSVNSIPNADVPAANSRLSGPQRVVVDGSGKVFFTDINPTVLNGRVYEVANGTLTVAAGDMTVYQMPSEGGPATAAVLQMPVGLALGPGGRIYVADPWGSKVWVLSPAGATSPAVAAGGVANAASLKGGAVAPGSMATVYGSFGWMTAGQAAAVPLPSAIDGLAIQIGNLAAPMFYASSGQANVQIPWEAAQGTVGVRASLNGAVGSAQGMQVTPYAPGIFTANGSGSGQGVIADSAYKMVDAGNPAAAGTVIQIYCTGLGLVSNQPATGAAASTTAVSPTVTTPTVTIGSVAAEVLFSGLVPGTVGEYQINAKVPAGVAAGPAVPVIVTIGGAASNTVTMAVK